jgi:hypothetical protein
MLLGIAKIEINAQTLVQGMKTALSGGLAPGGRINHATSVSWTVIDGL